METWITRALALGTIGCIIVFLNKKTDIMATEITHVRDIETLTTLGGMSIKTLEKLELANKLLLNAGDSIKTVLQKDWKTVSILGLTHFRIAQILKAIWNQAHPQIQHITFTPHSLKSEFLSNYSSH